MPDYSDGVRSSSLALSIGRKIPDTTIVVFSKTTDSGSQKLTD
jgi:hypothetical protein